MSPEGLRRCENELILVIFYDKQSFPTAPGTAITGYDCRCKRPEISLHAELNKLNMYP